MLLVTEYWTGEVMEINSLSIPLTGKESRLLILITIKLIARNRTIPTKINSLRENIKSANDYFL
jgi:hypothetical protein